MFRDITDRKNAEQLLIRSEAELNYAQEIARMGSWEFSRIGHTIKWSDNYYRLAGLQPKESEISYKYFLNLVFPEDKPLLVESFREMKLQKKPFDLDLRIRRMDGRVFWIQNHIIPFFYNDSLIGLKGVSIDINDRKVAEEKLFESEERYKSLFENSYSVMLLIDPYTGEIKNANQAACKYYGWTQSEICKMNISQINTLSEQEVKAELHMILNENKNHLFYKHRLASGEVRDVEIFVGPIKFGQYILNYAVVHDITDRKIAEKALATSEAALNYAQEISNMGSWEHDLVKNKLVGSKNNYHLLGLEPFEHSENLFQYFLGLVHPEDLDIVKNIRKYPFTGDETKVFDLRIVLPDGKIRWLESRVVPVLKSNQLIALKGVNMDVTDKRLKDDSIRNLSAAVEQSPICIVIADLQANVQYVNPTFESITQYSAGEIQGKNLRILQSGKTNKRVYQDLWKTILAGKIWNGEFLNRKKDGTLFWENAIISPITDSKGQINSFVGASEDITEKKKLLEDLIQAKNQA